MKTKAPDKTKEEKKGKKGKEKGKKSKGKEKKVADEGIYFVDFTRKQIII